MVLSDVMVDLSDKPKCEVICPFENCANVSKLSATKHTDLFAPPKFNPFNFERHFRTKHVGKKRAPFGDISNLASSTPKKSCTSVRSQQHIEVNSLGMNTNTPSTHQVQEICMTTATIATSSSDATKLNELQNKIQELEEENALLLQQQNWPQPSTSLVATLENKILLHEIRVKELENENILLHQQQQQQDQQSSSHVLGLESEILELKAIIQDLENGVDAHQQEQEQEQQQASSFVLGLKNEILKYGARIRELENENTALQKRQIMLCHKIMDTRGTVRAVCRLKPETGQQCFQWNLNNENTVLKLSNQ